MNNHVQIGPTTFAEFWHLGYTRLVPIIPPDAPILPSSYIAKSITAGKDPRGKAPGVRSSNGLWHSYNWTSYDADERDLARWQRMGAGVGLKTGFTPGANASVIAIDADTKDEGYAHTICGVVEKHFGQLPTRIGNAPKAIYLLSIGGTSRYSQIKFGDERVELLSDGQQFVMSGMHPGTRAPYRWARALSSFDNLPRFEPEALKAFMEELRAVLPDAKLSGGGELAETKVNQQRLKGDLEMVRKAVAVIPNTTELFPTREAYRDVAYAVKAALADHPAEAFEIFLEWSGRWVDDPEGKRNDPDYAEAEWKRMKPPFRRGADWLYELADEHGGGSFNIGKVHFSVVDEGEEARSRELHELFGVEEASKKRALVSPTRFILQPASTLPMEEKLYGTFYERGLVSTTVAPSGIGKSSLSIVEALAMASEKQLLDRKPAAKLRVWLWNGEDSREILQRRVTAAMLHYGLAAEDIGDRLLVDTGFDLSIKLGTSTRNGAALDEVMAAALTDALIREQIDVFLVDPFVSTHTVPESDNNAIDLVAKRWAKIAHDAKVAIGLVHHSRKLNGSGETTIEDARGASAFLAAMRGGRALSRMSPTEGKTLGLEHWRYFRETGLAKTSHGEAYDPKNNPWYTIRSVSLGNGPGTGLEAHLHGSHVGVVTMWNGVPTTAEVPNSETDLLLSAIRSGEWRGHYSSPKWVGHAVANALHLDDKADRARINSYIANLKRAGLIRIVQKKDETSRMRDFIEVVEKPAEPTTVVSNDVFG